MWQDEVLVGKDVITKWGVEDDNLLRKKILKGEDMVVSIINARKRNDQ